jgi:phospholipid transport system substrate-binding protein
MTAVAATPPLAASPATTRPSAKKPPAYMAGLDPKGLGKPEDIVRRRWDAVMRVLRDEKIDRRTKQSRVEEIVSPVFDFPAMTRLALGSRNWRKFTAPQTKEFSILFVKRLKESHSRRIAGYGGEKVVFKPPLPLKTPKGRKPSPKPAGGPRIVHVPVEIVSKTRRWTILHKFRKVGEVYRIYDIEIEGISILRSYRAQFNDILRRGTPEDLLSRLRKPTPNPPDSKGGSRP